MAVRWENREGECEECKKSRIRNGILLFLYSKEYYLAASEAAEAAASVAEAAASEAAEAAVSAALSAPPQAAKAKDNKAAANRDFFIFKNLF